MTSDHLKKQIIKRSKFVCYYCEEYGDTIDHKIALINGGNNSSKNMVCCCFFCNQAKSTLPAELYKRYVRRFGKPKKVNWWREKNIGKKIRWQIFMKAIKNQLISEDKKEEIISQKYIDMFK